jgi:hypothetical protein
LDQIQPKIKKKRKEKKKKDMKLKLMLVLVVQRIWATGYSSFALIESIVISFVVETKSSSTEILMEKLFLADLLIYTLLFYELCHSISWKDPNCSSLA